MYTASLHTYQSEHIKNIKVHKYTSWNTPFQAGSTAGIKQVNKRADESVYNPTKEKVLIKGIGVQIISLER